MWKNTYFSHPITKGYNAFAYTIEGEGYFDDKKEELVKNETLIIYREGDSVMISTNKERVRFLLVSGKPIREPVVWGGPIVMNTQKELETAFREFREGSFLKSPNNLNFNFWKQ